MRTGDSAVSRFQESVYGTWSGSSSHKGLIGATARASSSALPTSNSQ
jgi:hypothetical protein